MRIIYLHRTQGEEPESIHIREIVNALTALGHKVLVVGPAKMGKAGDVRPAGRLARVKRLMPRFIFELMQIGYNVVAFREVIKEIRRFKPDFIYERYALFGFAGILAANRARCPLILEVNTPYAHAWAKYYGLKLQRLAQYIEKSVLRAADSVITVTNVQRQFLMELYLPGGHVVVAQNAIDPDNFRPEMPVDLNIVKSLNKSEKSVVVGFVGTMNRWQGIPGFKEVIPEVLRKEPDVRFLFVGDGEYRQELEEFVESQGLGGVVVFTGRRAHREIPALVSAMDVAVLLNSNDYGSPMKIFEYWAMGKAVIAPRVAPVVEVMMDNENGIIIERGNTNALSNAIVMLVRDTDLRLRLGHNGRNCVLAKHTWDINARQILDEYIRVVAATEQA